MKIYDLSQDIDHEYMVKKIRGKEKGKPKASR